MSIWIDKFERHSVWKKFEVTRDRLNSDINIGVKNPEINDYTDRLMTVISFCEKRLKNTDPALVASSTLDLIEEHLSPIGDTVGNFIESRRLSELVAANGFADQLLPIISGLPVQVKDQERGSYDKVWKRYRESLELGMVELETTRDELIKMKSVKEREISEIGDSVRSDAQRLADLISERQTQIESQKIEYASRLSQLDVFYTNEQQRFSVLMSEHQTAFSSAQDKRATDFSSEQVNYLSKFTEIVTSQQTEFSTDQAGRRTAFVTWIEESQQKTIDMISEMVSKLRSHEEVFIEKELQIAGSHASHVEELNIGYAAEATAKLREIEERKAEVEKLVGVIGNLGVTSGYQKVANYARRMCLIWQGITISGLTALIFLAVVIAFPNFIHSGNIKNTNFSKINMEDKVTTSSATSKGEASAVTPSITDSEFYRALATRLFLSMAIGVFAAYSARQANHFLEMEKRNRKLALELEAFGPFIAPLSKIDADKLRVQIGDRSFGVPDYSSQHQGDDPVTALALAKKSKEGLETLATQVQGLLKEFTEFTKEVKK